LCSHTTWLVLVHSEFGVQPKGTNYGQIVSRKPGGVVMWTVTPCRAAWRFVPFVDDVKVAEDERARRRVPACAG
jgi:hypothetical protein